MVKRLYSVHNYLRFEIIDRSAFLRRFINKTEIQFKNFESEEPCKPDFVVEIGPFVPQKERCYITDDRYFIKNDYFYCKDSRKYAEWELEIHDLENRPLVKINTNLAGYYTAPLYIIEFFIQYMLLKKGYSLIHSSGVMKAESCFLFPARSGGGKTTVALSLLEHGYSYMGDNFILLDKGKAKKYLSPLNIFTYNRLPVLENSLSLSQKISMLLKKQVYNITGGYIKIFEKINPMTLLSVKICAEGNIAQMFFLEPNNDVNEVSIEPKPLNISMVIKKLRYNMELDHLQFNKYMLSFGYVYPRSSWGSFWENYEDVLSRNLGEHVEAYLVKVPCKYHNKTIEQLISKISQNRNPDN